MKFVFAIVLAAIAAQPALADHVGDHGDNWGPTTSVAVCQSSNQKMFYYVDLSAFAGYLFTIVDWSAGRPRIVATVSATLEGNVLVAQDRWYGPFMITNDTVLDGNGTVLATCHKGAPDPVNNDPIHGG